MYIIYEVQLTLNSLNTFILNNEASFLIDGAKKVCFQINEIIFVYFFNVFNSLITFSRNLI